MRTLRPWLSVSSQFQLVADLFHEKEDVASSKSSRVNVRAAKSTPKAPNKDHRKTVGHQVSSQLLSARLSNISVDAHDVAVFLCLF